MERCVIVGDAHGQYERLVALLRRAGICDRREDWAAGSAAVWFLGDFVDHGPDGIGVVELVMKLQHQAAAAGGRIGALLGNHEPLLLAAARFGARPALLPGGTFRAAWEQSDGEKTDLERLTPRHVTWLSQLPALAREGPILLAHADALFYLRYGRSVDEVNAALRAVLEGDDAGAWEALIDAFGEHRAFSEAQPDGRERARRFLRTFGGQQLIHGHTPIAKVTRQPPASVTQPLIYADGLCINVDQGLYLGGPGFVYELSAALG